MDKQISFLPKQTSITLRCRCLSEQKKMVTLLPVLGTVSNSRAKKAVSYVWLSHKRQGTDRLGFILISTK